MYYIANWKQTDEGFVADLPECSGYCVIAEPAGSPTFAILHINIPKDEMSHPGVEALSLELGGLIHSAEQYAPALAIARAEMRRKYSACRATFAADFSQNLKNQLALQRQSPYFLAAVRRTQAGYKYQGDFYWIVGYYPDRVGREISWVSGDYYIYQDALEDFDCDEAFLLDRFKV
jgi:hypothetical protein